MRAAGDGRGWGGRAALPLPALPPSGQERCPGPRVRPPGYRFPLPPAKEAMGKARQGRGRGKPPRRQGGFGARSPPPPAELSPPPPLRPRGESAAGPCRAPQVPAGLRCTAPRLPLPATAPPRPVPPAGAAGLPLGAVCARTGGSPPVRLVPVEPLRALNPTPSRERAQLWRERHCEGASRLRGTGCSSMPPRGAASLLGPGDTAPTQRFLGSWGDLGSGLGCFQARGGQSSSWDTPNPRRGGRSGHLCVGSKCGSTRDRAMSAGCRGGGVRLWGGLLEQS